MTARNLLDFDLAGLGAYCEGLGEKRFRATQLFQWLHQRGVSDFAAMSDLAIIGIGKARRHVDRTAPARRGSLAMVHPFMRRSARG